MLTADGFSGCMRDAAAGLPSLGKRKAAELLADAGATADEIMAALGHMTLAEAERYARQADRLLRGKRALVKLENIKRTGFPKPNLRVWGNRKKAE
ncbi:putative phage integrase (fragment) [Bradyrhizobium sp. ORS 375]|uniref:phage integrase n=1 Tax=Bradyrhizobium sp. (strain ORS 375) TaxID=566679 RepID=UPI0002407B2F